MHQGPSLGPHWSEQAQLPSTLASPPHPTFTVPLRPSPGGSLWQSWGVGKGVVLGQRCETLQASFGEGLLCVTVFWSWAEYTTEPT